MVISKHNLVFFNRYYTLVKSAPLDKKW